MFRIEWDSFQHCVLSEVMDKTAMGMFTTSSASAVRSPLSSEEGSSLSSPQSLVIHEDHIMQSPDNIIHNKHNYLASMNKTCGLDYSNSYKLCEMSNCLSISAKNRTFDPYNVNNNNTKSHNNNIGTIQQLSNNSELTISPVTRNISCMKETFNYNSKVKDYHNFINSSNTNKRLEYDKETGNSNNYNLEQFSSAIKKEYQNESLAPCRRTPELTSGLVSPLGRLAEAQTLDNVSGTPCHRRDYQDMSSLSPNHGTKKDYPTNCQSPGTLQQQPRNEISISNRKTSYLDMQPPNKKGYSNSNNSSPVYESNPHEFNKNYLEIQQKAQEYLDMKKMNPNMSFTPDQIDCLCEAMQQIGDYDKLAMFLWSLPPQEAVRGQESVLRAKAIVAYRRHAFHELYAILESHNFDSKYHAELQQLWMRGHYKEHAKIRGRDLGESVLYTSQPLFMDQMHSWHLDII